MVKIREHELQHQQLLEASKQAKCELQELVPDLRINNNDKQSKLYETIFAYCS